MEPSSSSGPSIETDRFRQDLLDAQLAADRGDYLTVKRRLRTLTDPAISVPAEIKAEADKLRRQVTSDPMARYLALGCLALFVMVVLRYVF